MPVLHFVEVLLERPIVPLTLGIVVAVLYGAGRAIGLPRLFWHEDPGPRFLAGLATTFLATQCLVDAYLLDVHARFPGPDGFRLFLILGAILWCVVIGIRSVELWIANARQARTSPERAHRVSVAPLVERIDSGVGAHQVGVYVHPAGFLAGGAVAMGISWGIVELLWRPPLPVWILPFLDWLDTWHPVEEPRLHLLQAVLFLGLLAAMLVLRRWATPAVGICILLALVIAAQSFIEYWLANAGAGLVLVVLGFWLGGRPLRKIRLSALKDAYDHCADYPPAEPPVAPRPTPLPWDAGLGAQPEAELPRRLIVVCASGGGIRAATWTAAILGRLDRDLPGFRAATRLITGASGGMVGAASWVALQRTGTVRMSPEECGALATAVGKDSLAPLARRLVFEDIPRAFLPWVDPTNRGDALEQAWVANLQPLGIDLGMRLSDLRDAEARGTVPTLVFSPMLVEDGRRLILSNRDLSELTENEAVWLSTGQSTGPAAPGLASQSAYHVAHLFPERWGEIPLSTAARLSASFPYASPAVVLPTNPRRRVVDAGYYDNYGLDLACSWLRSLLQHHADWMRERLDGILIVQIRDNVSQLSVNPDRALLSQLRRQGKPPVERPPSQWLRGFEGLSGPVSGVLSARESVMLFRNDGQLETVTQLYADRLRRPEFLTGTVFEFRGQASLSWTLARDELAALQTQAEATSLDPKVEAMRLWLQAGSAQPPS